MRDIPKLTFPADHWSIRTSNPSISKLIMASNASIWKERSCLHCSGNADSRALKSGWRSEDSNGERCHVHVAARRRGGVVVRGARAAGRARAPQSSCPCAVRAMLPGHHWRRTSPDATSPRFVRMLRPVCGRILQPCGCGRYVGRHKKSHSGERRVFPLADDAQKFHAHRPDWARAARGAGSMPASPSRMLLLPLTPTQPKEEVPREPRLIAEGLFSLPSLRTLRLVRERLHVFSRHFKQPRLAFGIFLLAR